MTTKHLILKIIFGAVIFSFGMALAYFTASYVQEIDVFDYWMTLLIYATVYFAAGTIVARVIPIILGFLFSSSWLILHVVSENFGDYSDMTKAIITGFLLLALYVVTYFFMSNQQNVDESGGGKYFPITKLL